MLLVAIEGLGAQDAGVAAWTVGVAFTEGTEEFGEEFVGALWRVRKEQKRELFCV